MQLGESGLKVSAVFALNRQDFGIVYPGMANDLIRNQVVLRLNVKAVPGNADFTAIEQAAQTGAAAIRALRRSSGDGYAQ